jgi:hypothetical protein
MAETLTGPKRGLPAMRGQSSLQVVYQQSQVNDSGRVSVRLHDPTREKEFALGPVDGVARLGKIPDSVKAETARGLTYFPLLPPHLSQRFFLDPNRGENGKLVLRGDFVDATMGDKYLLLNVLSAKDAATLKKLCLVGDPAQDRWNNAIDGLSTMMEKFVESPQQPGTYVPAEGAAIIGPGALAEVTDDDVAVDSYALTAVGPGSGYVSLIAGNGLAFTPPADPVSVLILRVCDTLYPGEVKIVQSPNPLSELLTMQQVVDLAGQTENYGFEWKIAAPVDGLPPDVYQNTYQLLLGDGVWRQILFPLASDNVGGVFSTPANRVAAFGSGLFTAVNQVPFSSVATNDNQLEFGSPNHPLSEGNQVAVLGEISVNTNLIVSNFFGKVSSTTSDDIVAVDFGRTDFRPVGQALLEAISQGEPPQSIVFSQFTTEPNAVYSQLWLSLDLDSFLGAEVYVNGEPVVLAKPNLATNTPTSTPPAGFNALPRAYRLDPAILARSSGNTHQVVVKLHSQALAGTQQRFNLRLEAYQATDLTALPSSQWLPLDPAKYQDGVRAVVGEAADVRALSDNYLIMRYRATNDSYSPGSTTWSQWTTPQLAEGWIKRVLAGINPFNQRITDLFNNRVNTDVSMLTQAGRRWEGDVALSLDTINSYGLIEIYETVLRRGRMLSIEAGINYGPANDALLLAAGYLNDLYMILGNEASADAANPTIGIGTAGHTYSDIATALFAFKGQEPSLLEEELALLRGRDDLLQPGVQVPPVYNRLVWNYTRGIDAGEVIYAVNYNIQENPDRGADGIINA